MLNTHETYGLLHMDRCSQPSLASHPLPLAQAAHAPPHPHPLVGALLCVHRSHLAGPQLWAAHHQQLHSLHDAGACLNFIGLERSAVLQQLVLLRCSMGCGVAFAVPEYCSSSSGSCRHRRREGQSRIDWRDAPVHTYMQDIKQQLSSTGSVKELGFEIALSFGGGLQVRVLVHLWVSRFGLALFFGGGLQVQLLAHLLVQQAAAGHFGWGRGRGLLLFPVGPALLSR